MSQSSANFSEKAAARSLLNRIKAQRLARNWTQREMAKRSGISFATYKNFEQGMGNITLLNLLKILGILNSLDRLAELVPPTVPAEKETLETLERSPRQRASLKRSSMSL
ncbi:transcriptional regulator [Nibricoccus aquaticus]|uniref:Transcriptional regulator n=1 Tax=Nibricoccus aquaticus TaxID=2576891 RepID=A0A290QLE1_9BACT|nr:helix-turn-helix transcriptional regulator [Nibricoccus aquaticus]ATC64802.1 transcriptional regulator [Nibricoccus aquaticus]